mgnify:CR=1 FL=1
MGFGRKLLVFIILVGIVFYLAYTYDKPLTCGLINEYVPSVSQILGCQMTPLLKNSTITINNITGYKASVFQNLTYKYNNASYGVNYTKQYELAKKANPNITNVVPFTNFTTFSNSIRNQAYLNSAYTEFSFVGSSANVIKYSGIYIQTYIIVSDYYYKNGNLTNYIPQLINKKIYVQMLNQENQPFYAPYLVKSEIIKGDKIYWNLTQDTGISNSNATSVYNIMNLKEGINGILGIYYNETEILFPRDV